MVRSIIQKYDAVCEEKGGRYLFHFQMKRLKNSGENLFEFKKGKGIDKTLKAIRGVSTNTNLGWLVGAMHWL